MGDGGMPYHLEKGPYWSVAEAVLNASKAERYEILEHQRKGDPLTDLKGSGFALNSTTLYDKNYSPTPESIVAHGHDFMGGKYVKGKWQSRAGMGDGLVGFRNYCGDIEAILRETFIRAIEVSFGLKHGETLDEQAPGRRRFWPMEFVWKCPIAWVEGWVTWQQAPDGSGHVTVHLLTPPHNHPVLTKVENGANAEINPTDCDYANGMWVITYEENHPDYEYRIDTSEFGEWNFPTFGPVYTGTGDVVTVAPSEGDGGVGRWGRAYKRPAKAPAVIGRVKKTATKKRVATTKVAPIVKARKRPGPKPVPPKKTSGRTTKRGPNAGQRNAT